MKTAADPVTALKQEAESRRPDRPFSASIGSWTGSDEDDGGRVDVAAAVLHRASDPSEKQIKRRLAAQSCPLKTPYVSQDNASVFREINQPRKAFLPSSVFILAGGRLVLRLRRKRSSQPG